MELKLNPGVTRQGEIEMKAQATEKQVKLLETPKAVPEVAKSKVSFAELRREAEQGELIENAKDEDEFYQIPAEAAAEIEAKKAAESAHDAEIEKSVKVGAAVTIRRDSIRPERVGQAGKVADVYRNDAGQMQIRVQFDDKRIYTYESHQIDLT